LTFLNTKTRNEFIIDKKKEGWTNDEISKKVKLSVRQIQNIWRAFRNKKPIIRKPGSGRKKVLTKSHKATIRNTLAANPYKSTDEIAQGLDVEVSSRTVNRYLQSIKWSRKKGIKKAVLTSKHKDRRLDWAKNHMKFKWSKVVFTDECNFELNQCRYGWAPKGQRIEQESLSHNPIVEVWGSMSIKGPVIFTFYEGNLKAKEYI